MASTYKTPGVYIEEISKLPPSVAQVETAVPAFIGYTEKAEKNGKSIIMKPTRITSLLEYENYFGGAYAYVASDISIVTSQSNNYAVQSVSYNNSVFRMYDALRMFFDNGGGKCYITAVNTYSGGAGLFTTGVLTDATELSDGLDEVEKFDEPTILLFPDAVQLSEAAFYPLQQAAIAQSAKLQDRVAVLDLKENLTSGDWQDSVDNFRNNIGINDLKYAMAYTPWIYNAFNYTIDFSLIRSNVFELADLVNPLDLTTLTSDSALNTLVTNVINASADQDTVDNFIDATTAPSATVRDRYNSLRNIVLQTNDANAAADYSNLFALVRTIAHIFPTWRSASFVNQKLVQDLDSFAADGISGLRKYVGDLATYETSAGVTLLSGGADVYPDYNNFPVAGTASWLGDTVANVIAAHTPYPVYGAAADRATAIAALNDLDAIFNGIYNLLLKVKTAAGQRKLIAQNTLYFSHPIIGNIVASVQRFLATMPPGGAVAGIYAKVDNDRGVWKAPANVSLSSVIGPTVMITNDTQDGLNVDTEAGKSINAIRAFTGKGTLIWGARTLAGNDNEWRYVSVRRFYNMVEESVKKASAQFVFEPNDANTWVKVKAMIENYLTILWRQGALAGAKAEHAFFVKVGLGETMTAIDILEGRMNVEIGMAVVRPAEFIILKFSHKMQES